MFGAKLAAKGAVVAVRTNVVSSECNEFFPITILACSYNFKFIGRDECDLVLQAIVPVGMMYDDVRDTG